VAFVGCATPGAYRFTFAADTDSYPPLSRIVRLFSTEKIRNIEASFVWLGIGKLVDRHAGVDFANRE
jgi:hypothetical protein